MNYLPEWKIYLIKKLLLSTDEELDQFSRGSSIPSLMHYTGLLEKDGIDEEKFFKYLLDLASEKPPLLELDSLRISRTYEEVYKKAIAKINALKHRKQIASLGSGVANKEDYIKVDEYCELGKNLYTKMVNGEHITISEFKNLLNLSFANSAFTFGLQYYTLFEIKLNRKGLKNKLDNYIDSFLKSDLIPAQGENYYSVDNQRKHILQTLKNLSDSYGYKNIALNLGQIANGYDDYGNLIYTNAPSYKFYESILSLERTGDIVIKDIRDKEVVLSVISEHLIQELEKPFGEAINSDKNEEHNLSVADKKKLSILEKLKEEWDLTPKSDDEGVIFQTGMRAHLRFAGETKISHQKYLSWTSEAGISDWYEFENILNILKEEGLILKFESVDESR
ncbi:hypothetical protein [Pedobacter sp.]|jgi:hypothetical protein|uniref:hypothetical protein n=1 Tax=Pedobacter sp. TaxID=1411316 RepID=UPI002BE60C28|nr:hypothetical protein [Pedobacter sp.]HWW41887.1 hypothetical protein [Pedobacter sp.]